MAAETDVKVCAGSLSRRGRWLDTQLRLTPIASKFQPVNTVVTRDSRAYQTRTLLDLRIASR